ncbi:hypothetical protein Slit_0381 [Sideroxydans lithotrophicus ES-1]|uniref:Uncharacterized protein n=1 Tax=Sideroxydans lithotrophicus (strain ES-1) TaxID=580332 RepID=D5CM08_SIDLE|nr:hypothetical protein Slit_0381 [Sideroxydans lithotrophicus ES-1]
MRKSDRVMLRRFPFVIPWINSADIDAFALNYNTDYFPIVHSVEPNVQLRGAPKARPSDRRERT